MLTRLSIRNIVLIEALDLAFGPGLGVLTGETGAGKSILLDALGLVLGARAEAGLIRAGESEASVTASFEFDALPAGILAVLEEAGVEFDLGEPLILKRRLKSDGASKAFVNDQPVGAALLRELAGLLVELHGQHDDRGLVNPRGHRLLLDRFAKGDVAGVEAAWSAWRGAREALDHARARIAKTAEDRDLLLAYVAELAALAPQPGEEQQLASSRADMQKGERLSGDLGELQHLWAGSDSALASLRGAARRLDRIAAEHPLLGDALAALDRAVIEASEAEDKLARAAEALTHDPQALDRMETRLFELRAAARKHGCTVDELAARMTTMRAELDAIEHGEEELAGLERAADAAGQVYRARAEALHAVRAAAALRLDGAVAAELAPLRLDAAQFRTAVTELPEERWGPQGLDSVEFLISTNPGADFAPLAKIASGGELSRFILALKVALAEEGGAATVIFDEIDRGVGGAVASAIGERLARLAANGQLLAVTHSPQVAARGATHYVIAKSSEGTVTRTSVHLLDAGGRQEEIARMLSGAEVTPEARAQADRLLEKGMTTTEAYFREGYAALPRLVPREVAMGFLARMKADFARQGHSFDQLRQEGPLLRRPATEIYGYHYAPMVFFHWGLAAAIEAVVGTQLLPTYCYFRIYREGDICRVHGDRPACEHSLSLTLAYSDGKPWPLEVSRRAITEPYERADEAFGDDEDVGAVAMEPGDAVLYQGVRHHHGRTSGNPNAWSAHLFLHWVARDGPFAESAFDGQMPPAKITL